MKTNQTMKQFLWNTLLMIALSIAMPVAAQNIALNKPVTVSSTEAVGTPGGAAVDGNLTSRWSSTFSDAQFIYVDLGATTSISRVKITWENAYGKDYQLQVSANAT